jgi:hypothetical protein
MPRNPRDYQAEYRHRIERGRLKGLSASQARGHRLANERALSKRPPRPLDEHALQVALRELRKQGSIAKAARSVHISKERLRRVALENGLIERPGGRWKIADALPRAFLIFERGKGALAKVTLNAAEASKAGTYMAEVGKFLNNPRLSLLLPFEGQGATDLSGRFHPFETDPNRLFRLTNSGDRALENIYRIVI